MAVGPISHPQLPAIQPVPSRDVGAAQKAFFQAALGQVQAASAPAIAAPAQATAARPAAKAEEQPDPTRGYRPGRLLDITV